MNKSNYILLLLSAIILCFCCDCKKETALDSNNGTPNYEPNLSQENNGKIDCNELVKYTNIDLFKAKQIDDIEWMVYNLDIDTFRNGDKIPEVQTDEEWTLAGHTGRPAWCYFNNNPCNVKYGKLYNFHAIEDPRGLAPEGWRIASDEDWVNLTRFIGDKDAGYKLKSKTGWFNNGNGGDVFGFDAKPNGMRYYGGHFLYYGTYAYYWTGSSVVVEHAHLRYMREDYTDRIFATIAKKGAGMSVRCIKDYPKNKLPYARPK